MYLLTLLYTASEESSVSITMITIPIIPNIRAQSESRFRLSNNVRLMLSSYMCAIHTYAFKFTLLLHKLYGLYYVQPIQYIRYSDSHHIFGQKRFNFNLKYEETFLYPRRYPIFVFFLFDKVKVGRSPLFDLTPFPS